VNVSLFSVHVRFCLPIYMRRHLRLPSFRIQPSVLRIWSNWPMNAAQVIMRQIICNHKQQIIITHDHWTLQLVLQLLLQHDNMCCENVNCICWMSPVPFLTLCPSLPVAVCSAQYLSPCGSLFCSISLSLWLSVLLNISLPVSVCSAQYLSPCVCLFCSLYLSIYLSVLLSLVWCLNFFCSNAPLPSMIASFSLSICLLWLTYWISFFWNAMGWCLICIRPGLNRSHCGWLVIDE